jgi:hypothetical protein
MKTLLTFALLVMSFQASADQYVNGYTRRDGGYVQPHYRTESNSTTYDNYSSQGNVNPYTGQPGYTPNAFSQPQPQYMPQVQPSNRFFSNPYDR